METKRHPKVLSFSLFRVLSETLNRRSFFEQGIITNALSSQKKAEHHHRRRRRRDHRSNHNNNTAKNNNNKKKKKKKQNVPLGVLLRRRGVHLANHLRRVPRSREHGGWRRIHPGGGTRRATQPRGERARLRNRMVRILPTRRTERRERTVRVLSTVLLHDDRGTVARPKLEKFEQSD